MATDSYIIHACSPGSTQNAVCSYVATQVFKKKSPRIKDIESQTVSKWSKLHEQILRILRKLQTLGPRN